MKEVGQAFIDGMENAIDIIREDMEGGALRQFDLHTWKVIDKIEQMKKLYAKQNN